MDDESDEDFVIPSSQMSIKSPSQPFRRKYALTLSNPNRSQASQSWKRDFGSTVEDSQAIIVINPLEFESTEQFSESQALDITADQLICDRRRSIVDRSGDLFDLSDDSIQDSEKEETSTTKSPPEFIIEEDSSTNDDLLNNDLSNEIENVTDDEFLNEIIEKENTILANDTKLTENSMIRSVQNSFVEDSDSSGFEKEILDQHRELIDSRVNESNNQIFDEDSREMDELLAVMPIPVSNNGNTSAADATVANVIDQDNKTTGGTGGDEETISTPAGISTACDINEREELGAEGPSVDENMNKSDNIVPEIHESRPNDPVTENPSDTVESPNKGSPLQSPRPCPVEPDVFEHESQRLSPLLFNQPTQSVDEPTQVGAPKDMDVFVKPFQVASKTEAVPSEPDQVDVLEQESQRLRPSLFDQPTQRFPAQCVDNFDVFDQPTQEGPPNDVVFVKPFQVASKPDDSTVFDLQTQALPSEPENVDVFEQATQCFNPPPADQPTQNFHTSKTSLAECLDDSAVFDQPTQVGPPMAPKLDESTIFDLQTQALPSETENADVFEQETQRLSPSLFDQPTQRFPAQSVDDFDVFDQPTQVAPPNDVVFAKPFQVAPKPDDSTIFDLQTQALPSEPEQVDVFEQATQCLNTPDAVASPDVFDLQTQCFPVAPEEPDVFDLQTQKIPGDFDDFIRPAQVHDVAITNPDIYDELTQKLPPESKSNNEIPDTVDIFDVMTQKNDNNISILNKLNQRSPRIKPKSRFKFRDVTDSISTMETQMLPFDDSCVMPRVVVRCSKRLASKPADDYPVHKIIKKERDVGDQKGMETENVVDINESSIDIVDSQTLEDYSSSEKETLLKQIDTSLCEDDVPDFVVSDISFEQLKNIEINLGESSKSEIVEKDEAPQPPSEKSKEKRKYKRKSKEEKMKEHEAQAENSFSQRLRNKKSFKICSTLVDIARYSKRLNKIGGTIVESIYEATILIAGQVTRTEKFLVAIVRGLPIVTIDWLEQSVTAKSFLSPQDFIIKDEEVERRNQFCLVTSLRKAKAKPLLTNYLIFCSPSTNVPPKVLEKIVKTAGGEFKKTDLKMSFDNIGKSGRKIFVQNDDGIDGNIRDRVKLAFPKIIEYTTMDFTKAILRQKI